MLKGTRVAECELRYHGEYGVEAPAVVAVYFIPRHFYRQQWHLARGRGAAKFQCRPRTSS